MASKRSLPPSTEEIKPLIRKTQPYRKRIAHKGIWVEPKLLAEIEYRAKSAEGKVRHPILPWSAGGPVMDAFDRFWQCANKPWEVS